MQVLTKSQVKKMNWKLVRWFELELKRDFGNYLYNLVLQTKSMIEDVRRDKGINTCSDCGKEFTPFEKYRKHLDIEMKKRAKLFKGLSKKGEFTTISSNTWGTITSKLSKLPKKKI